MLNSWLNDMPISDQIPKHQFGHAIIFDANEKSRPEIGIGLWRCMIDNLLWSRLVFAIGLYEYNRLFICCVIDSG